MSFVSGKYSVTWNGAYIGQLKNGFYIRNRLFAEPISGDSGGDSHQDFVDRGSNVYLQFTSLDWDLAVHDAAISIFWPHSASGWGTAGTVGSLYSARAKSLVMTALTGTPAATVGPVSITVPQAVIAPGQDQELFFGNANRDVPILLQALPYVDGSSYSWFASG